MSSNELESGRSDTISNTSCFAVLLMAWFLLLSPTDRALDAEDVGEAADGEEETVEVFHVFDFGGDFQRGGAVAVGLGFDGCNEGLHFAENVADVGEEAGAVYGVYHEVDGVDLGVAAGVIHGNQALWLGLL